MRGGRRNDLGDPARHGIDVSDTISPKIAAEIDTVFLFSNVLSTLCNGADQKYTDGPQR